MCRKIFSRCGGAGQWGAIWSGHRRSQGHTSCFCYICICRCAGLHDIWWSLRKQIWRKKKRVYSVVSTVGATSQCRTLCALWSVRCGSHHFVLRALWTVRRPAPHLKAPPVTGHFTLSAHLLTTLKSVINLALGTNSGACHHPLPDSLKPMIFSLVNTFKLIKFVSKDNASWKPIFTVKVAPLKRHVG